MILPTKHISTSKSLIGIGSKVLANLRTPRTVSSLWECMRDDPDVGNYQRFILCLDFLYMVGGIELNQGRLRWCNHD